VRNRIFKTAAESCFTDASGEVTQELLNFYETIASGGAGLVIVESPTVDYPLSMANTHGYRIDDDRFLGGLSRLAGVIHKHDCPAFIQLHHAGPWHRAEMSGMQPVSVSDTPEPELPHFSTAREISIAEIQQQVVKFADAAERAAKAGFDGVEINAAASHLLAVFLSKAWNRRRDRYGVDSLENRSRFLLEIIRAIKQRNGGDYPVTVIINGLEMGREGALTLEESSGIAQLLEVAGTDAIQVRFHVHGNLAALWPEQLLYPEPMEGLPAEMDWSRGGAGAYLPIAAAIRNAVDIPVMGVGRLDPELGERALRDGQIDLVGMTRRLVADPQLPNKVMAEREADIAPCTACLCCLDDAAINRPLRCRINGHLGARLEEVYAPAQRREHVVVVGTGPSGMEAARMAGIKGHRVTLLSRDRKLGGLMRMAAMVKGQEIEQLEEIVAYYERQLSSLGVEIKLGRAVTPQRIVELNADQLILATGGVPAVPEIPGLESCRRVIQAPKLMDIARFALGLFGPETAHRLSKIWMPVGRRVVIIGGAIHGCELAEFLVKRGRRVTLVHLGDAESLGDGMTGVMKFALFPWLAKRGVEFILGARCQRVSDRGLELTTVAGESRLLEADSFVTALPLEPDTTLLGRFQGVAGRVTRVGDCAEPGLILNAINAGAKVFESTPMRRPGEASGALGTADTGHSVG